MNTGFAGGSDFVKPTQGEVFPFAVAELVEAQQKEKRAAGARQ
jgi:hypothetical protein